MVGVGEHYLPAFVLVLAFGEVASGWIVALPPMIGAIVQLSAHTLVTRLRSHKRLVVTSAALQAVSWVPLIVGAILGAMNIWLVFGCVTLYHCAGMLTGAAWSTWIGTVVPRRVRARYFGTRSRALQVFTLAGFIGGALALSLSTGFKPPAQGGDPRVVFNVLAGMFAVAALSRAVSAWHLWKIAEPEPIPPNHRHVSVRELFGRLRSGDGASAAHLLLYVASVWLASNVAAPFINPYLLHHHAEPYLSWASLVGLVMFGKIVTLAVLSGLAQRHGARTLLIVGGVGIVPIGAMWAASDAYAWIVGVQLYSGMVWACWELGLWLLVLERFRDDERTSLMGYYFLLNQVSMAVGALVGGWALAALGKDTDAYQTIFVASTVARLVTLGMLMLVVLERRRPVPNEPASETVRADTSAWEEGRGGT